MENKIVINSEYIANYVMFKLDKLENEFTYEELNRINELTIDFEEVNDFSLEELSIFSNLISLNIKNMYIYNEEFSCLLKLKRLNNLYLENCELENADLIASLSLISLSLINCKINNYSFISVLDNLEELSIINGNINISNLNKLKNLNYLKMSYSKILDLENNLNLDKLNELHIDNTNINNLEFTKDLTNIKKIILDNNQYNNNSKVILYLKNKNVNIYDENMIEFGGELNDI